MPGYKSHSDLELLQLLKKDDHDAYAQIYDRFNGLMYIYACKIVKDFDEAEDIVQEVFISLWDKRNTLVLKSSLSSYLYSAVRYKFINLLDHKKVRTDYSTSLQSFLDEGEYLTDDYIREKEFKQLIEKEIALLPEKMREIFVMSREQNLSNKEIAEKLDLSEKTVRNQVNNALNNLRTKLGLAAFLYLLTLFQK